MRLSIESPVLHQDFVTKDHQIMVGTEPSLEILEALRVCEDARRRGDSSRPRDDTIVALQLIARVKFDIRARRPSRGFR